MALYEARVRGKKLDLSALEGVIVSGDNNADTIRIVMDRVYGDTDMSQYAFTVVGRNSFGQVVMKPVAKLTPLETDVIRFDWAVTGEFTDVSGLLDLWFSTMNEDFTWSTIPQAVRVEEGIRLAEYTDIGEQYLEQFSKLAAETEGYKNEAALAAGEAKGYSGQVRESIQAAALSALEAAESAKAAAGSAACAQAGVAAAQAARDGALAAAQAAEQAKTDARAIKDSTEVQFDVQANKVGFKRAGQEQFSYTGDLRGEKGDAATVAVGVTETLEPGGAAAVTNSGTGSAAVLNFQIPKGDKGDKGGKGDTGATPNLTIGTVTTGAPGTRASVSLSGSRETPVLSMAIPSGKTGDKGATGDKGDQGDAATVRIGAVYTGAAGSQAAVTNVGTPNDAVLNMVLPRGDTGPKGDKGDGLSVAGSFNTVEELVRTWPNGNGQNSYFIGEDIYVWDASANRWVNKGKLQGPAGADGKSAYRIALENGFVGSETEWLATLKGDKGEAGEDGVSATVRVGSVTTGAPGSEAAVSNSGTALDAAFDFKIPRGADGKSAFESAQDGGYAGNEMRFNADLASIPEKANRAQGAVEGNLAAFDAAGDLADSGRKPGDFAPKVHSHGGYALKAPSPTAGNLAALDAAGSLADSGLTPAGIVQKRETVGVAIQSAPLAADGFVKVRIDPGAESPVLTAEDIGARPDTWTPTAAEVGADPAGAAKTVQDNLDAHAGNTDIHVTAAKQAAWDAKAAPATVVAATLTAAGWTGEAAPFTQSVAASGVTADAAQVVEAGLADSATQAQREAARAAMLSPTGKAANSVTVTADGEKPTVDLPVTVVIFG